LKKFAFILVSILAVQCIFMLPPPTTESVHADQSNIAKAKSLLRRGIISGKQGNYDKAIANFTKALELNPRLDEALFNRGIAWSKKEDPQKAIQDFDKALELNPNNTKAIYYRRIAIEEIDKSLNLELPEEQLNSNNWYEGGIEKLENKLYDQAIADFKVAIEIKPDHAEAFFHRAIAWDMKGDRHNAITDFTKALEIDPGYEEAYVYRGIASTTWL